MKKKLFSIFAIILVMVMAFTLFAACDDDPMQVEGKVFVYDRAEAYVVPGMEDEMEAFIAEMGDPEISTIEDYIVYYIASQDYAYEGFRYTFYQGFAYMSTTRPSVEFDQDVFEFTQDGEKVFLEGLEDMFRVEGDEFVFEVAIWLAGEELCIVTKYIFAYEREATAADVSGYETPGGEGVAVDVDGKTFVFESFDVEVDDEAKETLGTDLDKYIDYIKEQVGDYMRTFYSTYEMTFKDGKFTATREGETSPALDYEQDGKIITIDGFTGKLDGMAEGESVTITVSGSKLVMEQNMRVDELGGIQTYKLTFKQK